MFDVKSLIGREIHQFRVEQFIAKGAMGMVFKAYDTVLSRTVALKLIPKALDDDMAPADMIAREEALKRLLQEAKAAGRLTHPNVVTIYSYGETEDLQYICMEYVRGITLARLLSEKGALSEDEAFPILDQVLLALDAADKEGIIHRDIKPANIMITDDNRVEVADFGIAKLPTLSITVTGMVLGTPFYMSPEQILGKKVDIRSDVFSVGTVFYEVLTGERPFTGDNTAAISYQITQVDPVPPDVVKEGISSAMVHLILKALAKDPDKRYQTPRAMLEDLRAVQGKTLASPVPAAGDTSDIDVIPMPGVSGAGQEIDKVQTRDKPDGTAGGRRTGRKMVLWAGLAILMLGAAAAVITLSGLDRTVQKPSPEVAVKPAALVPVPVEQPARSGKTVPSSGEESAGSPLRSAPELAPQDDSGQQKLLTALERAKELVTGNPKSAKVYVEEALRIDPGNLDGILLLAKVLSETEDYAGAIAQYRRAIQMDGELPEAFFGLGLTYMKQGNYEQAITSLESCRTLVGDDRDDVLMNLGVCYLKAGRLFVARSLFRRSLEINPANSEARKNLDSLAVNAPRSDSAKVASLAFPSAPGQPPMPATASAPRESTPAGPTPAREPSEVDKQAPKSAPSMKTDATTFNRSSPAAGLPAAGAVAPKGGDVPSSGKRQVASSGKLAPPESAVPTPGGASSAKPGPESANQGRTQAGPQVSSVESSKIDSKGSTGRPVTQGIAPSMDRSAQVDSNAEAARQGTGKQLPAVSPLKGADSATPSQTVDQVASLPPAMPASPPVNDQKAPPEPPSRPDTENAAGDVSRAEIQKFLRKWDGYFEVKLSSTSNDVRHVAITVNENKGSYSVIYEMGPPGDEKSGYNPMSSKASPPGRWKYDAYFEKRKKGTYLVFTIGSGLTLEFKIVGRKLIGTVQSSRVEALFELTHLPASARELVAFSFEGAILQGTSHA